MFGISRPTTFRPGIGASIRIVRAASAMARSSASPSIRLTLIDGSGSTSYCVTTGPAFQRVTRLGMLKLASLLTMIAALCAWSMPAFDVRGARSSRSDIGGRWYSRRAGSGGLTGPDDTLPVCVMGARVAGVAAPSSGKSVMRSPVSGAGGGPAKTDETCAGCSSGGGISGLDISRAFLESAGKARGLDRGLT